MAEEKKVDRLDLNIVEVLNLSAKILQQVFITANKVEAKKQFKTLKQGKKLNLGSLTIGEKHNVPFKMDLNYKGYIGPGFGFDAFEAALKSMLHRVAAAFKDKKDLNPLTSETGVLLAAIPGVIQRDDQMNVMMMSFEFGDKPNLILSLMFVDPSQIQPKKESA